MTEYSQAVFLSYASQDAETARRIADALRSAGIEVWFDQGELRGGDVWDQQIRRQIKDCALFVPLVSASTDVRTEGYFRLEWKLGVERSHLMADDAAFLLPVVIDDTPQATARVPHRFRELQWTRLPGGSTPPDFVERIARLLSADQSTAPTPGNKATVTAAASQAGAIATRASSRRRPTLLLIAVAAVSAAAYLAVDRPWASKRAADSGPISAPAPLPVVMPQSPIPEKSIAVLPFVDLSQMKDQEYFSDGLSAELIDLLTKVPDLRVPARTSSFFFKGKAADIATIAQQLRVAHVLEGSVRKAGNTIQVTAELVRADNGYRLWSETYIRDLKDVFKVQDAIAGAVVAALKLKLKPTPGPSMPNSRRTSNIEAYNQYLLGRQFYARSNADGFRRATDAYRKAVQLDPNYALAYAQLALSEYYIADPGGAAVVKQEALATADKAVMLAPDDADAQAVRGFLRAYISWDWAGAQTDFEKALALDPDDRTINCRYGKFLASNGRLAEALAAAKEAIALDPLSSTSWSNLGLALLEDGQLAAAQTAIRRSLEIQPESTYALSNLGAAQLLEGKAAQALATFRQVTREAIRLAGVAMAEHALGHVKESQQALDELIAKHAQDSTFQVAQVYAWRGAKDKAFEWLERAYQQRDDALSEIKVNVLLASLRGDARFAALLRKMQLPE